MNILATQYTLHHKSLEVYIAGCGGSPHCTNCHNPESWDFNQGDLWNYEYFTKFTNKVREFDSMIDNIMIFGGEPLDQDGKCLHPFLIDMANYNKKVWLFTRYGIDEVPEFAKEYCDYIKCGRYIEELKTDDNIQYGIKLATKNQKIYKKGVDY